MPDAHAEVSAKRRIPVIWLVPIAAALLGLWMVIYTIQSEGPEITIEFSTAEGIEAGKTKLKMLSVDVGQVETAQLSDDLQRVIVTAQLEKEAAPLLREDTQFWVVRPRIGPGGVSGLGTVLSGGYIQIEPGKGKPGARSFVGLDEPPVTPANVPGLHLVLKSKTAHSVSTGDPVLYKGFRVGRVESENFDVKSGDMRYPIFIQAPYDELVNTATRFWNASGVSVSASAEGVEIETGSLESLLLGGIAMGTPEGVAAGEPVTGGTVFELYPNLASASEHPYHHWVHYVVRFPRSIRGLNPGAPVEYRGIRVGEVERVMMKEFGATPDRGQGAPIPVLIRVEPGRLELPDSEAGIDRLQGILTRAVGNGLRASLETGSLLTGSLYVSLEFYPDEPPAETGEFAGHRTIPTIATGLAGIERRLTRILDKINELPLDQTLARVDSTLADLNTILASESMQQLPASLDATLAEARNTLSSLAADSALQGQLVRTISEADRTLASLRALLDTLGEQPNALVFNRKPGSDPEPPAGAP